MANVPHGHVHSNDVLGSLRYAVEHLKSSLKLVVVLGHSGCGALSAAVYGIYLLQSREVWAPRGNTGQTIGLAEPPTDFASFVALGEVIVRSDRIASLLTPE